MCIDFEDIDGTVQARDIENVEVGILPRKKSNNEIS